MRGMRETLMSHRPNVTIEVGDLDVAGAPASRALLDYVVDLGYAPFEWSGGRIRRQVRR